MDISNKPTATRTISRGSRISWSVALLAATIALTWPASASLAQSRKPGDAKPAAEPVQAVEPAPVAPSGKSLVIPEALKAKGKAYHAQPGGARQISFLSDAPFEKITGHSNQVLGFAISGPDGDPAKLAGGEWRLVVKSLRTGNTDRDSHLTQPEWLDAAKFPHILFRLKDVRDIKTVTGAKDPSLRAYTATLVGDMTIHGVTKELTIKDTVIRFRPKSPNSAVLADGDFMFIVCKFSVSLSDFGITHSQITTNKKVSNTIEIDTQLMLASVAPEDQPQKPAAAGPGASSKPADEASKPAPK